MLCCAVLCCAVDILSMVCAFHLCFRCYLCDVDVPLWMYLSCGHNMSVRIFVPVDVYGVDISVCCGCC